MTKQKVFDFSNYTKFLTFMSPSIQVLLNQTSPFRFFKGCLPQILLGPLLNTLSHVINCFVSYLEKIRKPSS